MSSFPNKPDQLLIGVVMVSVNGNGGVVLDPVSNTVYASDYYIGNNSLTNSIGDLDAGITYITDIALPAIANNQNDANTYFNDINVAILGLDQAVENAQNDIINLDTITSYKDSQEFYVSADGNDTTGTGSQLQPYQTIQKAIDMAELVASSSSQMVVYIAPGVYTENLTISKGYISLIGESTTAVQAGHFGLNGDITINITTTDDLFQNFTILQGLVIRGSIVDQSSKQHSLTVQDCRIIVPNTRSYGVKVEEYIPGAYVDKRIRLVNCQIAEGNATAFTDSLVLIDGGGWLYIERCDLTTKSVISALEMGSSTFLARMALCSIECESSSVSLPPQIFFNQINVPPANTIQSIGQVTIVAPNGGGATGANGLNTAIHIATGVATTSFTIYGVITGIVGNTTGNDIITNQFALAVPLIYADFLALPGTANKIGANFTSLPMSVIS